MRAWSAARPYASPAPFANAITSFANGPNTCCDFVVCSCRFDAASAEVFRTEISPAVPRNVPEANATARPNPANAPVPAAAPRAACVASRLKFPNAPLLDDSNERANADPAFFPVEAASCSTPTAVALIRTTASPTIEIAYTPLTDCHLAAPAAG